MLLPLQELLTSFRKFWSYFKVWFWQIGDKRDESNWRKQIKLMKIQMHNERNNAIGLDRDLEVIEVDSKERSGRNDKKEWKIMYFHFAWSCEMDKKTFFATNQREISKLILHDHAKISHNHVKWSKKEKIGAVAFSISHNHAKLLDLVWNGHFITKLQISWSRSLQKTS